MSIEQDLQELREENRLLREQMSLLLQAQLGTEPETESYLLVRSNISGYTTIIHPDLRFRGAVGDKGLGPYSEIVLPALWKDSPNLGVSVQKGIVTVTEVDEPPSTLVTMPEVPGDSPVLEPEHRRMAMDIAQQGADSDAGTIASYPIPLQMLFFGNPIETDTGIEDVAFMQDIVYPILALAAYLEKNWRKRRWVLTELDDRMLRIVNLTRRRQLTMTPIPTDV